eukprot:16362-Pelagococcus_subviridis.AAC.1
MSNTSHCLLLKNVAGPTGGPNSGGTTTLRFPPSRIPFNPSSNPGIMPLIPRRVLAGARCNRTSPPAHPSAAHRCRAESPCTLSRPLVSRTPEA